MTVDIYADELEENNINKSYYYFGDDALENKRGRV